MAIRNNKVNVLSFWCSKEYKNLSTKYSKIYNAFV